MGVGAAQAQGSSSADTLNKSLTTSGLTASASSDDATRTSWKVWWVDYRYSKNWEATLGYVDLGKVSSTISGTTDNIDSFLNSIKDLHMVTARGWSLTGAYRHPINDTYSLKAKLGGYFWSSDYSLSGGSQSVNFSDSGSDVVYGIGTEMKITPALSAQLEWARYTLGDEPVDLMSLGLVWAFK